MDLLIAMRLSRLNLSHLAYDSFSEAVLVSVSAAGSGSLSAKSKSTMPKANSISYFHFLKFEPFNSTTVVLLLLTAKETVMATKEATYQ